MVHIHHQEASMITTCAHTHHKEVSVVPVYIAYTHPIKSEHRAGWAMDGGIHRQIAAFKASLPSGLQGSQGYTKKKKPCLKTLK